MSPLGEVPSIHTVFLKNGALGRATVESRDNRDRRVPVVHREGIGEPAMGGAP